VDREGGEWTYHYMDKEGGKLTYQHVDTAEPVYRPPHHLLYRVLLVKVSLYQQQLEPVIYTLLLAHTCNVLAVCVYVLEAAGPARGHSLYVL
jgi:hypothetical protein